VTAHFIYGAMLCERTLQKHRRHGKVAPMYQKMQATARQAEALFDWERPRVTVDTWENGRT
jgi:hypothetical protein